jgi:FKBP-type peptidyl-prolyl cis-trans isomerase SlyD
MQIGPKTVVKFEYIMEADGELVERTHENETQTILIGHAHDLPPCLERYMHGHKAGEQFSVTIPAAEMYGLVDETKKQRISRDQFPDTVEIGEQLFAFDGDGKPLSYRVVALGSDDVEVDGNHALAGKDISYTVTIHKVREAEPGELDHGHVHGEGGVVHHHHDHSDYKH